MQRIKLVILSVACWLATIMTSAIAEPPSLMQMIAKWQYPDSAMNDAEMADGETIDSTGKRTTQSIVCKTVLTTDAPIEKVLEYYKTKLKPKANADVKQAVAADPSGRSIVFFDDSDGRPFVIHTVIVNDDRTSTTLVISRGKDESKTHIAWKHYQRLTP